MFSTRRSTRSSSRRTRHESTLVLNTTPWAEEHEVGTRLKVLFNIGKRNEGWFEGTIMLYDKVNDGRYHVHYDDGEIGKPQAKDLDHDVHTGQLQILKRVV